MVKNMVMITTNIAEVKAKLSEYLDRAMSGERVVICRHNKPVAELRALDDPRVEPRPIGPLPGRPAFDIASSFFDPLPDDEVERWEGAPQSHDATIDQAGRSWQVAESKASFDKPTKRRRRKS
jgi:antitoxin (DNA-binding transcriptional repressor) of toxin-antitoxin stability system